MNVRGQFDSPVFKLSNRQHDVETFEGVPFRVFVDTADDPEAPYW
jgi:hypothetical protein